MSNMDQSRWAKEVRSTFHDLRHIMKKFNINVIFTDHQKIIVYNSIIHTKGNADYLEEMADIVIAVSAKRNDQQTLIQYDVQKSNSGQCSLIGTHAPYGAESSFPNELIEMVGSVDGALVAIQGNAGSFRTTTALILAFNRIAPFSKGQVLLYDGSMSVTRDWMSKTINMNADFMRDNIQIIKNRRCTLAGFKDTVQGIAQLKEQYQDIQVYEVGQDNVTGERTRRFIPTYIVIDEIASIPLDNDTEHSVEDSDESADNTITIPE